MESHPCGRPEGSLKHRESLELPSRTLRKHRVLQVILPNTSQLQKPRLFHTCCRTCLQHRVEPYPRWPRAGFCMMTKLLSQTSDATPPRPTVVSLRSAGVKGANFLSCLLPHSTLPGYGGKAWKPGPQQRPAEQAGRALHGPL